MTSSPSCEAEETDGAGSGENTGREGAWLHKAQVRPPLGMCVSVCPYVSAVAWN